MFSGGKKLFIKLSLSTFTRKRVVFILSTPTELSYWKCNSVVPFPAFWWRKPRYTEFVLFFQKTWVPNYIHTRHWKLIRAEHFSLMVKEKSTFVRKLARDIFKMTRVNFHPNFSRTHIILWEKKKVEIVSSHLSTLEM